MAAVNAGLKLHQYLGLKADHLGGGWLWLLAEKREGNLPPVNAWNTDQSSNHPRSQFLFGFCRNVVFGCVRAFLEPVVVAVHLKVMKVMGEAIEPRISEAVRGEHTGPLAEGKVAGDDKRAALL